MTPIFSPQAPLTGRLYAEARSEHYESETAEPTSEKLFRDRSRTKVSCADYFKGFLEVTMRLIERLREEERRVEFHQLPDV